VHCGLVEMATVHVGALQLGTPQLVQCECCAGVSQLWVCLVEKLGEGACQHHTGSIVFPALLPENTLGLCCSCATSAAQACVSLSPSTGTASTPGLMPHFHLNPSPGSPLVTTALR
jgi:hypothetical protein